jgi:hypothetical protein
LPGRQSERQELRHRDPDLVVLNYGTNESGFAAFLTREYEKELREAIRGCAPRCPMLLYW